MVEPGSDSLRITVAVLPPFPLAFVVDGDQPRYDAAWDALPSAVIEADTDTTLREVLRVAGDALGVRRAPEAVAAEAAIRTADGLPPIIPAHAADHLVFFDFWREGDDDVAHTAEEAGWITLGRNVRRPETTAVVRDASGHAVWRKPGLDATMGEILDGAESGLIEGDPLRPYLIPSTPQGDLGGLTEWITFSNALKGLVLLYAGFGAASAVDGTLGLTERLQALRRRKQHDAAAVVVTHASIWNERGAAPSDLLQMLARRPRPTAEVAALLGCSAQEAEALLWGLGFVYDDQAQLWSHRGDPLAALLADNIDLSFADISVTKDGRKLLEQLTRERVRRFLATGEAPPMDEATMTIQQWMVDDAEVDLLPEPRRTIGRLRRKVLRRRRRRS